MSAYDFVSATMEWFNLSPFSRSSTGEGVFIFGTQESVLITHTLETVIDRLARMKRAKNMKFQQVNSVQYCNWRNG